MGVAGRGRLGARGVQGEGVRGGGEGRHLRDVEAEDTEKERFVGEQEDKDEAAREVADVEGVDGQRADDASPRDRLVLKQAQTIS